jgi:alkylation response protein AidB-like acyl-CoA dehydrogenase
MRTDDHAPATSRDELVARVRALGPVLTERAVHYDREARFPTENFADFHRLGLLSLCVPTRYGGLGASYADYVRVSEEIGRYCGSTALTFNMHNATMLWCGEVADLLSLTDAERTDHESIRAEMYRGVVEHGHIHSQPFSEGTAPGATSGVTTKAVEVEGGWRVTGRKIFASLSGAADFYNVTCIVPGEEEIREVLNIIRLTEYGRTRLQRPEWEWQARGASAADRTRHPPRAG